MSKPNIAKLQQINTLRTHIEAVNRNIAAAKSSRVATHVQQDLEAEAFEQSMLSLYQNSATLEKLEADLHDFRLVEGSILAELRTQAYKTIDAYLEKELGTFVVKKNKELNGQLLAGKAAQSLLPTGTDVKEVNQSDALRIETADKDLIFDITRLREVLCNQVINTKLSR
jgi:hypothetical protein